MICHRKIISSFLAFFSLVILEFLFELFLLRLYSPIDYTTQKDNKRHSPIDPFQQLCSSFSYQTHFRKRPTVCRNRDPFAAPFCLGCQRWACLRPFDFLSYPTFSVSPPTCLVVLSLRTTFSQLEGDGFSISSRCGLSNLSHRCLLRLLMQQ